MDKKYFYKVIIVYVSYILWCVAAIIAVSALFKNNILGGLGHLIEPYMGRASGIIVIAIIYVFILAIIMLSPIPLLKRILAKKRSEPK